MVIYETHKAFIDGRILYDKDVHAALKQSNFERIIDRFWMVEED